MPNPDRVASSPDHICPVLNGAKVPQVTVKSADGEPFDLPAATQTKPTLLVFYRGGW